MLSFSFVGHYTYITWSLNSVRSHTCVVCLSLLDLLFPFASAFAWLYRCFISLALAVFCVPASLLAPFSMPALFSRTVLHACFVFRIILHACFVFRTVLRADLVFSHHFVCRSCFLHHFVCRFCFSHGFVCFMLISLACHPHCLVLLPLCFFACICI